MAPSRSVHADAPYSKPLSPRPLSDVFTRPRAHYPVHHDNSPYFSNPAHRKQHFFRAYSSHPLTSIWSPLFWPRPCIFIISPYIPSLSPCNECYGTHHPGLHTLARYPTDRCFSYTWRTRPVEGLDQGIPLHASVSKRIQER